jgi:hypothetical protein
MAQATCLNEVIAMTYVAAQRAAYGRAALA